MNRRRTGEKQHSFFYPRIDSEIRHVVQYGMYRILGGVSMLSTVFWVYSLLVFGVSFALCIWLGYRRGVFNSAIRLGFFLFSGILAFILAKALVAPIGRALSSRLVSAIGEDLAVLTSMNSILQLIVRLCGGLLAPIAFMLLFFVIDKLTFFAYVPLKKKFAGNEKLHNIPHDKLFGAILGGVLAFCITLTCVLPVGGYPNLLAETTDQIAASSLAEELSDEMTETVDEWVNTPAVKVDYALSGWLFRGLTSDARTAVSSCFSLLNLVDTLQNAEDASSVSAALQELPTGSLDLLVSLTQDLLTQLAPDDESSYQAVLNILSEALDKLPTMRDELSSEEYVKEIQVLATLTMMLSDPSSVTNTDMIKVVLSSSLLTEVMVKNSDVLAEELSDVTAELSAKDKQEIKKAVNEYADEFDMDDKVVSSVLSILGIS